MTLGIDPRFAEFLHLLSEKKPGIALAFYSESVDFLTVLMGWGDLRNYMLGGIIMPGADVLLRWDVAEDAPLREKFAGLEIWGGIRGFLSHHYRKTCGDKYEDYRNSHNLNRGEFSLLEILTLLKNEGFEANELWSRYENLIMEAIKEQQPKVHIPLK
jgi:hypothetical protein